MLTVYKSCLTINSLFTISSGIEDAWGYSPHCHGVPDTSHSCFQPGCRDWDRTRCHSLGDTAYQATPGRCEVECPEQPDGSRETASLCQGPAHTTGTLCAMLGLPPHLTLGVSYIGCYYLSFTNMSSERLTKRSLHS